MTKPVTGQTTFGSNTTGTTTQLDNNFLLAYAALNDLNTYNNYLADTGSANTYVVTIGASLTGALTNGLQIQMKAANANSGASTLAYNGGAALNILNLDGSALSSGQIPANSIVQLQYRASDTTWILQTPFNSVSGMQLIQQQTANANANLSFTTGFTTSPREHLFVFTAVTPGTNDAFLIGRCSVDGGNTYISGAANYTNNFLLIQAGTLANSSSTASSFTLSTSVSNTASDGGVNGEMRLFNANSNVNKHTTIQVTHFRQGTGLEFFMNGAELTANTANSVNAVQFTMSSGTFNGTISHYIIP